MDGERFDRLARVLAARASRRGVLRGTLADRVAIAVGLVLRGERHAAV